MWNLYLVKHPIGTFIGVAKSVKSAKQHFGEKSELTLITDEREIIRLRLEGPERIFLAI